MNWFRRHLNWTIILYLLFMTLAIALTARYSWFILVILALIVMLYVLSSWVLNKKHQDMRHLFMLGFVINPLIILPIAAIVAKEKEERKIYLKEFWKLSKDESLISFYGDGNVSDILDCSPCKNCNIENLRKGQQYCESAVQPMLKNGMRCKWNKHDWIGK